MNLDHIRTIVAVWRERSISKAAKELALTQPAVSGHVKAMEEAIGKPLFHRHARGVTPTEAANDLVHSIGDAFEVAEAAVERVRHRSDASDGVVHFGAPVEFGNARLSGVFVKLMQAGLQPRLRLGGRDQLYQWFEDGDIDIGVSASEPQLAALNWEPIFSEKLLLVGSETFRPDPDASLADWVRSAPWLAYDESLALIRIWVAKVANASGCGRPLIVAPSLTLLRDIAIDGGGVTVLPHYLCEDALESGKLVKLFEPPHDPTNVISLCWRRRAIRSARVGKARDICLAEFRNKTDF